MSLEEMIEKDRKFLAQNYPRHPVAFVRGEGSILVDSEGNRYIDCFGGVAVVNTGHSHPKVIKALREQAGKLVHTSNWYYVEKQVELGELLYRISGGYKSFFCNSGAEAVEAAIKLARKYTGKKEIISMHNSFHGRTLGTLAATGQEKFKKDFEPLVPGFKHVEFGSIDAVEDAITEETAAVLVEPIQGEGGVVIPPEGYLEGLRDICDRKGVLMILDEIQTGFGRTGSMFTWQGSKIKPDIFTLAKALGAGFPIGAMLAKPRIMDAFKVGDHGTTFGGSPLACATALASVETILDEKLVERSKEMGGYFLGELIKLKQKYPSIKDIRGKGLIIGVELNIPCKEVVEEMIKRGVLINCTHEKVLRFVPPLVITRNEISQVIYALDEVLKQLQDGT